MLAVVAGDAGLGTAFTATAVHGAPAALTFIQQPTDTEEDRRIRPPPAVAVTDRLGNRVTSGRVDVSMTLVQFSGSPFARLRGGTERRTESGVAVFEDLRIDRTGSGFRLQARAGGLTVDSEPFRVYDD